MIERLRALEKEYRPTMNVDVLHAWAKDVTEAIAELGQEVGAVADSPSLLCLSDECANKGQVHHHCTPRTVIGDVGAVDFEALARMWRDHEHAGSSEWGDGYMAAMKDCAKDLDDARSNCPKMFYTLGQVRKHFNLPKTERETSIFTSPAHTSEARDAVRYRWLAENAIIQWPGVTHIGDDPASTRLPLDNAIDAAMRQEAGSRE